MENKTKISIIGMIIGVLMVASPLIKITEWSGWIALTGFILTMASALIYGIFQPPIHPKVFTLPIPIELMEKYGWKEESKISLDINEKQIILTKVDA